MQGKKGGGRREEEEEGGEEGREGEVEEDKKISALLIKMECTSLDTIFHSNFQLLNICIKI